MKKWTNKSEKGQVLVILTVGIVVLIGFAALAIDGGMFYSDRRYEQNVSDNAALAGARAAGNVFYNQNIDIEAFDCSSSDVIGAKTAASNTAQAAAIEFNVPIYPNLSEYDASNHGVYVSCADGEGEDADYMLVRVKITSETKPHFAQLVFGGTLTNSVEAVARVEPGVFNPTGPAADGDGLVGLADDCDGESIDFAADLSGNVKITILSGGVHSNSGLQKDGASGYIKTSTGSEYRCVEGGPVKVDPFEVFTTPPATVQEDPTHTDTLVTLHIDPPDCELVPEMPSSYNMVPGRYTNISLTAANAVLTMAPGLYCWDGVIKIDGGSINVSGAQGDGVTIYFVGSPGSSFTLNGNGDTDLRAPSHADRTIDSGYAISGLLFYTSESYTGEVKINGTAGSEFRGTFFVPSGTVNIGGTSGTDGWNAQWLAKYVKFHGNPEFTLNYTADDLYWDEGHVTPALLDVYK